jgi:hypothetical protein
VIKNLVVFVSCVVLIHGTSRAEDCSKDPGLKNATLNTVVCKALDDVFRDFIGSCSLTYPVSLTKNSDLDKTSDKAKHYDVSAVPDKLLTSMERSNMATPVRVPQNLGMSRLLSQVFTSKSINSLSLNDYISATATQQLTPLTQLGIDGTVYTTSCQSTLAANASAQTGFSFAPATIRASLEASLNSKSNSGVSVTVGNFDSPLWVYSTNGFSGLYPNLLMFTWRLNHNKESETLYYLAHAKGFAASQLTSGQITAAGTLNTSLSAGYVIISTKGDIQVDRSMTDSLSLSFYDTVVDNPPESNFESIPSLTDLQNNIAAIQLTAAPTASSTLSQHAGDQSLITQVIDGIPADMCEGQTTTWAVSDNDLNQKDWEWAANTLQRKSNPGTNIPSCTFTFSIVNKNGSASFIARPVLTGTYKRKAFTLKIPALSFEVDPYPLFLASSLYDQTGKFTTNASSVPVLEYAVPIGIGQSTGGYNAVSWKNDPITATCTNGISINLFPASTAPLSISTSGNSQPTATLDYGWQSAKGSLDKSDPIPNGCTLDSGTLIFSDTTSATRATVTRRITKDLGLTIKLPRIKPELALKQIGNSVSNYTFAGIVTAVTDFKILNNSSATLYDGTAALKPGQINQDLSIDFGPVNLDPSVTHSITIGLSQSGLTSAATSTAIQIPIIK